MKEYKSNLIICLLVLIFTLISCSTEPDNVAISADGVPISFEVQGKGEPALVFVHGWCCDKSYWDAQVPYFAQKYKVVTIDLAGHGESGLDRTDWTIAAFGEDVVAVVAKLDLYQSVLIGHSMGGPTVLEAARRMPKRIIGLVGVDIFWNVESKPTRAELDELYSHFHANFAEATRKAMLWGFIPTSDSTLVEWVLADMSASPPEVGLVERSVSNISFKLFLFRPFCMSI